MTVESLAAQLSQHRKKLRQEEQIGSAAESTPLGIPIDFNTGLDKICESCCFLG